MKKIISVLLAVFCCFSATLLLISCGDDNSAQNDHSKNEGSENITNSASISKEKWVEFINSTNYTYKEEIYPTYQFYKENKEIYGNEERESTIYYVNSDGAAIKYDSESTGYFAKIENDWYYLNEIDGKYYYGRSEYDCIGNLAGNGELTKTIRIFSMSMEDIYEDNFENSVLNLDAAELYDKLIYDEEKKAYVLEEYDLDWEAEDIEKYCFYFENEKLIKIEIFLKETPDDSYDDEFYIFHFYDFGETNVDLPEFEKYVA